MQPIVRAVDMLDKGVVEYGELGVGARGHDGLMTSRNWGRWKNDKSGRGSFCSYIFGKSVMPQYNFVCHPLEGVLCPSTSIQYSQSPAIQNIQIVHSDE
jgi:hypothetical protein